MDSMFQTNELSKSVVAEVLRVLSVAEQVMYYGQSDICMSAKFNKYALITSDWLLCEITFPFWGNTQLHIQASHSRAAACQQKLNALMAMLETDVTVQ